MDSEFRSPQRSVTMKIFFITILQTKLKNSKRKIVLKGLERSPTKNGPLSINNLKTLDK